MQAQKKIPFRLVPLIILGICFSVIVGIFLGVRYLLIVIFVRLALLGQGAHGIILFSRHTAWSTWSDDIANGYRLVPLIWNERRAWHLSPATMLLYATVRSHSSFKKDRENPRKEMYPSAVIFGRSFFPTTIRFAHAWQKKFKGDGTTLETQMTLLRDGLVKTSSFRERI